MKCVGLNNLVKKDVPLHYRNEYTAQAQFSTTSGLDWVNQIFFSVEMHPTGKKDIKIEFLDNLDYPLVPVLKSLKEHIHNLDREGKLL